MIKHRYDGYKDSIKRFKEGKKEPINVSTKILIIIFIAIIILIGSITALYFRLIQKTADQIQYKENTLCTFDEEDGINILVMGTDERIEGDTARADMIMLCSIDVEDERIRLISFQRDLYVRIPGREGKDRLAHAFAYGQGDLAVQTIVENFQIPIDGYVVVNMASSLYQVIDAFGGAKVELTQGESALMNGYIFELNQITGSPYGTSYIDETTEGMTVLDGRQALSYARIRYIGEDSERTSRQREVVVGMIENLKDEVLGGNLFAAINLYQKLPDAASCIQTSISKENLAAMMQKLLIYLEYEIESDILIPQHNTWNYFTTNSGMSVIEFDIPANAQYLQELLQ